MTTTRSSRSGRARRRRRRARLQWTPIGRALQHALAGLLAGDRGEGARGALRLAALRPAGEWDDPRQLVLPLGGDEAQ